MHSTQKSVIINKAICRFKHEEKEDEFHAKRMESIQPLKWKEQKETVSMSAQYIHDTGQRIYGNGGNSRSGESGNGDTGRCNHTNSYKWDFICSRIKDVKVGSFHYYRFQGTDTANIDKVTLKSADESALKIEQRTVKDAEGKDVIEYMPIALKDNGTVKVTATFESKQINKGTIEFEFNLAKADDNVVPVTSYFFI